MRRTLCVFLACQPVFWMSPVALAQALQVPSLPGSGGSAGLGGAGPAGSAGLVTPVAPSDTALRRPEPGYAFGPGEEAWQRRIH